MSTTTDHEELDRIILAAWEQRPLMECSHDENSHFAGYLASFDRADYTIDFECLLESERDAVREYTEGVIAAIEPAIVERERRAKVEVLEQLSEYTSWIDSDVHGEVLRKIAALTEDAT